MALAITLPVMTPSFGGEAHAGEVEALAGANRIDANRYLLCVPNIRFSMDAENGRGKFAT